MKKITAKDIKAELGEPQYNEMIKAIKCVIDVGVKDLCKDAEAVYRRVEKNKPLSRRDAEVITQCTFHISAYFRHKAETNKEGADLYSQMSNVMAIIGLRIRFMYDD